MATFLTVDGADTSWRCCWGARGMEMLLEVVKKRSLPLQNSPQAAAQQQESDTTQQAERQVTRMVVAMVMAFLICWLPYTTFALVVATNKDITIQPALASLPSYFSKTATVYNPIIYVFMNKQVRGKASR